MKLTINKSKIKELNDKYDEALKLTAEMVLSDIHSKQVVPHDTGTLEDSAFVRKEENSHYSIVFNTPYARRLYFHPEYNFRQDKNPNARGRWMDSYKDGEDYAFVLSTFAKNAKGGE